MREDDAPSVAAAQVVPVRDGHGEIVGQCEYSAHQAKGVAASSPVAAPQTPNESDDPSPKYQQFNDWSQRTNALAEWVYKQADKGDMSAGRLACVFDVVEFQTKQLIVPASPVAEGTQDEHTCGTPNYTDGPCYACAKEKLLEWIFERYENCQRIAKLKTGDDRKGWLEDADHFLLILALLKSGRASLSASRRDQKEEIVSAYNEGMTMGADIADKETRSLLANIKMLAETMVENNWKFQAGLIVDRIQAASQREAPRSAQDFLNDHSLGDLSLYWPTHKPLPRIDYASGEVQPTLTSLMEWYARSAASPSLRRALDTEGRNG